MELEETGVRTGTHSAGLGAPLIQMGQLLHPLEMHQSRATDITVALSMVQAELALTRAEVLVLRTAIATQLEHAALLSEEAHTLNENVSALIVSGVSHAKLVEDILATMARDITAAYRDTRHHTAEEVAILRAQIETRIALVGAQVAAIPDTYFWPRFKRWMRGIFGL